MKTAIVTGANGFVGSALANKLSESGVKTYAIVRNKQSNISRLSKSSNTQIIYCDMKHIDNIIPEIQEDSIDCFFHFAWEGTSGPKRADELLQLNNVANTCLAINVSKRIKCSRFVFASSIMEFEYEQMIDKGLAPAPSHVYSAAKAAARRFGNIIAINNSINFNPVIISNIFGQGEVSPRLINTTILKLLRGESPSFTSGIQNYDFIYINDAVSKIIAVATNGKPNKNYYIGSANPKPLKEFLLSIRDTISPQSKLNFGTLPFNGISLDYNSLFDLDAVTTDTGCYEKYSFEDGIICTAKWLKENYL